MNKQDLFKTNENVGEKTNTELMDEIVFMLENSSDEELDVNALEAKLALLDERAPIEESYDPDASWNALIEKYPFMAASEEKNAAEAPAEPAEPRQPEKKKKGRITVLRTLEVAVIAAALLVLFANASGHNPIETITKWTGDIFSITANTGGSLTLPENVEGEYRSLREALDENGAQDALCPTWIPKGFALESVEVTGETRQKVFWAVYSCADKEITVSISTQISQNVSSWLETEEHTYIKYRINEDTFHIFANANYIRAFCSRDGYNYTVWGHIAQEELLSIVDSLYG